jgi:hypothetical protein
MSSSQTDLLFKQYLDARSHLIRKPEHLIALEEYLTSKLIAVVLQSSDEHKKDYDAASILYPFWQNYPPDDRGRKPIGDQYPWIEVGEHAIGTKVARNIGAHFEVSDLGFPTGPDQRFLLKDKNFENLTDGKFKQVWLCLDIKSVGPRDDQDHAVMSHNQISGTGDWEKASDGVTNKVLTASGKIASHDFYVALPPIIVDPDGIPAPVITMALKPVYSMESGTRSENKTWSGQPLKRIDLATIPNGLLLSVNPNYLASYPGLLFPGKDDKSKDPRKLRARISFEILRKINPWRHATIISWK